MGDHVERVAGPAVEAGVLTAIGWVPCSARSSMTHRSFRQASFRFWSSMARSRIFLAMHAAAEEIPSEHWNSFAVCRSHWLNGEPFELRRHWLFCSCQLLPREASPTPQLP